MTVTFKGSCTSNGGVACNANTAVTWSGGTPGSGDSIFVFVYCTTAVNDFISVTDSAGNTYTQDYNYLDGSSAGHAVYRAQNISGTAPTWIRINKTTTSNICYVATAHAGVFTGAAEGITQYTEGASTTTHNIPYTTSNSNDLVLMYYHGGTDFGTPSALGSWAYVDGVRNATDMFYLLDAGAAGSYNFTFTAAFCAANMVRAVYKSAVTDPTVSTVSSPTATEGSPLTFTVTLSGATNRSTNYAFTLGGTATGADYTSTITTAMCSDSVTVSGGTFTVPTGVTSWTVTVPTTPDTIDEADQTVIMTVVGVAGTGTITDDDAPPTITVSDAVESFGTVTHTLTLSQASGKTITVQVDTANGSKTAGVDYTAIVAQTVTFNPGETSKTAVVTTL